MNFPDFSKNAVMKHTRFSIFKRFDKNAYIFPDFLKCPMERMHFFCFFLKMRKNYAFLTFISKNPENICIFTWFFKKNIPFPDFFKYIVKMHEKSGKNFKMQQKLKITYHQHQISDSLFKISKILKK